MQGGGRLVEAAAGGAEEDDQSHPRDEHLQLFEVRLFVRDSLGLYPHCSQAISAPSQGEDKRFGEG